MNRLFVRGFRAGPRIKRPFTQLALAALVSAAVFFSACSNPQAETSPAPEVVGVRQVVPSATPDPAATPEAEPIAARVNGAVIPLATLERAVNRRLEGIRAVGDPMPADMTAFRLEVLEPLIEQLLIEQAAALQDITVTDEEVQAELDAIIALAGSPENWAAQLEADHMTEDEYREALRSTLITMRMRDLITAGVCIAVEQVHARHIVVLDEATASDIRRQLEAGGDFATLAATYSLDVTTNQLGGDLGWFARGQLLQRAVEAAAFTLEVGAISAPVRSELGYHIIQVLEHEASRAVEDEVCYRLTETIFERWIQDLKTSGTIERYPDGASA